MKKQIEDGNYGKRQTLVGSHVKMEDCSDVTTRQEILKIPIKWLEARKRQEMFSCRFQRV